MGASNKKQNSKKNGKKVEKTAKQIELEKLMLNENEVDIEETLKDIKDVEDIEKGKNITRSIKKETSAPKVKKGINLNTKAKKINLQNDLNMQTLQYKRINNLVILIIIAALSIYMSYFLINVYIKRHKLNEESVNKVIETHKFIINESSDKAALNNFKRTFINKEKQK